MTRFLTPPERPLAVRWVVPVDGPPIENAELHWEGDTLVAIEPTSRPLDRPTDAVLPALVNPHTHLDLSDVAGPVGAGSELPDWLPQIATARASDTRASIDCGLAMCHRFGVGLVADIQGQPVEVTPPAGVDYQPFTELLASTTGGWANLEAVVREGVSSGRGLSPHATYSVPLPQLAEVVALAGNAPVMMHVAEHAAERELLEHGTGRFADMLRSLGVWVDGRYGDSSMTELLSVLLRAERPIIAHGNDFSADDIDQIAEHENAGVVWCPQTHAFFRQPRHPVAELRAAGVCVAIGTDSLASSRTIDPWDDVRHLIRTRPDLSPADVVAMSTRDAARLLDRPDRGTIAVGMSAPLIAVPLASPNATDWAMALFGAR